MSSVPTLLTWIVGQFHLNIETRNSTYNNAMQMFMFPYSNQSKYHIDTLILDDLSRRKSEIEGNACELQQLNAIILNVKQFGQFIKPNLYTMRSIRQSCLE